ncbi:AI-2E family transporter [Rhodobacteraceae bacterium D3-12]|nr:AI-2E family transporter [Rhodobacteraceae bacterium D3-12]
MITRITILGIGVVVAFSTLSIAKEFFAPVLSAMVFGVVLSPFFDMLARLKLRPSLAAFVTVGIAFSLLAILTVFLEPYVSEAITRAPVIWYELRDAVEQLQAMMLGLNEIAEDVAKAIDPDAKGADKVEPAFDVPPLSDALFYAPQFLAQVMIFVGVLYFFLMTRPEVYRWLGATLGGYEEADFTRAEAQVARYFLTITAINAGFGLLVGIVLQLIGLPGAVFWGVMAFMLNYVLYLGPIALAGALLVTGLVAFDGAWAVVPAALYLSMNATEGQFVTPALVGQRLSVNPLLVFVSLVFWLWLWGPIGGVIAIPLLVWSLSVAEVFVRGEIERREAGSAG